MHAYEMHTYEIHAYEMYVNGMDALWDARPVGCTFIRNNTLNLSLLLRFMNYRSL
jgi:hypothetical protein